LKGAVSLKAEKGQVTEKKPLLAGPPIH
jgi:hypothetical protein